MHGIHWNMHVSCTEFPVGTRLFSGFLLWAEISSHSNYTSKAFAYKSTGVSVVGNHLRSKVSLSADSSLALSGLNCWLLLLLSAVETGSTFILVQELSTHCVLKPFWLLTPISSSKGLICVLSKINHKLTLEIISLLASSDDVSVL